MRDPNRIPKILEALKNYWQASPDLRLGQIVINMAQKPPAPKHSVTTFYMEDNELLERLIASTKPKVYLRDLPMDKIVLGLRVAVDHNPSATGHIFRQELEIVDGRKDIVSYIEWSSGLITSFRNRDLFDDIVVVE